jgi:hypothetical protein
MPNNVGYFDRGLRVLLGLALLAWATGFLPGIAGSVWGWIGVVPLLTGLFGTCPVYSLLGINTCARS